jgi:hypothetical protein
MDSFQFPWDVEPAPEATPAPSDAAIGPRKPRGRPRRQSAAARQVAGSATRTARDWLYHHLTVSGPIQPVQDLAAAARGSGVIPWQLDYAAIEEEVFVRAVSQPASHRNLTVEGCRILARQFRERVEAHQARAALLVGRSSLCAFDLHRMLPVPAAILQRGPTDPSALAWLAANWGVTDRLRQVTERPKPSTGRRLPQNHAVIGYGFFTVGETPHVAMAKLGARWPALRFALVPRPPD